MKIKLLAAGALLFTTAHSANAFDLNTMLQGFETLPSGKYSEGTHFFDVAPNPFAPFDKAYQVTFTDDGEVCGVHAKSSLNDWSEIVATFEDVTAKLETISVRSADSVSAEKAWRENDPAAGKDAPDAISEISYENGYGIVFHSHDLYSDETFRDGSQIVLSVYIRGGDTPKLVTHAMRDMDCYPNIED